MEGGEIVFDEKNDFEEIENKIEQLFEKGNNNEGIALLNKLSDKEVMNFFKDSVIKYGEKQIQKDVYCVMQHMRAFNYQISRKQICDWALPCSNCFLQCRCKFEVYDSLTRLAKSNEKLVICAVKNLTAYAQGGGKLVAERHKQCLSCEKCNLYMMYVVFQRIEAILLDPGKVR